MQKIKKTIFYSLLIITLCIPLLMMKNVKADDETEEEEETAQKGDLRCPLVNSPNTTCTPIKYDSDGNVLSVELTFKTEANGGDLTVKKRVTKKSVLGHYDVEFEVSGVGVKEVKVPAPAYIMVVVDMSKTISGKISKMKNAVKKFAQTLIPSNDGNSNFYLGLIQFASDTSVRRKFSNENFENVKFLGYNSKYLGKKSHVEKAYSKANSLFNEVPSYANKYLFLFGDGRYWSNADTETSKIVKNANKLKEKGVVIYGARYSGTSSGSDLGRLNSAIRLGCKAGKSYGTCDTIVMKKIINQDKYYGPSSDWDSTFETIANDIKLESNKLGYSYTTDLTDEIGSNFFLVDDDGRYKKFNVGKLEENGKIFGPFEIEIDPYAPDGWHETNEQFSFSYLGTDNTRKQFTVPDNPEVYWKSNKLDIEDGCSGSVQADDVQTESTGDINNYFSSSCYEGYKHPTNNKQYSGYKVSVKVNNLKPGITNFTLKGKEGFPITVDVSTNVICTYKFDVSKFQSDYNRLKAEIAAYDSILNNPDIPETAPPPPPPKEESEEGEEESETTTDTEDTEESEDIIYKDEARRLKEYAQKTLQELEGVVTTYSELTKATNLEEYKIRFEEQPAVLRVDYKDSERYDELELATVGEPNLTIDCGKVNTVEVIPGKSIENDKICTASFSKTMELPETCLSMKTGEQEGCSPEVAQLSGGRLFFVNLQENDATLDVMLPNGGYRGNYNVKMQKNGDPVCSFTSTRTDINFRSIDLDDPFLTNYDPNRGVGGNYDNNKYKFNFEKIIKEDTWQNNDKVEYVFYLSKTNIYNIKKDTQEDFAESYVGRNCYFTDTNKYYCQFPRNESDSGTDNGDKWFYDYKVNDDIN